MTPKLPFRLGPYEVRAKMGEGGMAIVYLGRKVAEGPGPDLVAIKMIRDELARGPEFVTMFMDEAKLVERLRHPNVVRYFELGREGPHLYLAMELLLGQSLFGLWQACRARKVRLRYDHIAWICARVADGLHHAHDLADDQGRPLGIVHRDVNATNVIVTYDGEVKVIDFGLAKAAHRASKTAAGVVKGKVAYMSPEQAVGRPVDRRTDVFALGIMLWELGCDRRLFRSGDDADDVETLRRVDAAEVPDATKLVADFPPELWRIARKALARDPDRRYPTAAAIAGDLDAFVRGMGTGAGAPALAEVMIALFGEDRDRQKAWVAGASRPGVVAIQAGPVERSPWRRALSRMLRFFVLSLLVLAVLLPPRAGLASPPEGGGVVVLAVAPDARELDAGRLRVDVGQELGAQAIDADDPRAAGARGRIDVSIDRGASQLVVSYRGSAEPIERRVDLPADSGAIAREAVLLAGNLARDEASELVAQLRRPRSAQAPAPAMSPEDQAEVARDDRLRRVLAGYARRDRALRLGVSWSVIAASVATAGVGLYVNARQPGSEWGMPLFWASAAFAGAGVVSLAIPSDFESMSAYYDAHVPEGEPRPGYREEVEQRWRRRAEDERLRRLGALAAGIGLGLAYGAIDAFVLAKQPNADRTALVASGIAVAAAGIGLGVFVGTTRTTTESRLRAYEGEIGHPIEPSEVSLSVVPVPGGIAGGLGGSF